MFFFSTLAWSYYKYIMYSSSSSLCLSLLLFAVLHLLVEETTCVLSYTGWTVWLTCICAFCPSHTHTHTFVQRVHIYTLTVQGHPVLASKPTHLGWLGGGAFEYTVVVWLQPLPGFPADVCALALLDSLPHSAVRDLTIQLSFALRQLLNSSCTNTYTLNQVYIKMTLCQRLSAGAFSYSYGGCWSGGLMRRIADSFKGTDWWGVMAQHQLDWAGLQEVDFEVRSLRVIALKWTM